MKTLFATVVILMCAAGRVAAQSPAPTPRWEYGRLSAIAGRTLSWAAGDSSIHIEIPLSQVLAQPGPDSVTRQPAPIVDVLNRLGAQGWEMVAATDNTYMFKRRKP